MYAGSFEPLPSVPHFALHRPLYASLLSASAPACVVHDGVPEMGGLETVTPGSVVTRTVIDPFARLYAAPGDSAWNERGSAPPSGRTPPVRFVYRSVRVPSVTQTVPGWIVMGPWFAV